MVTLFCCYALGIGKSIHLGFVVDFSSSQYQTRILSTDLSALNNSGFSELLPCILCFLPLKLLAVFFCCGDSIKKKSQVFCKFFSAWKQAFFRVWNRRKQFSWGRRLKGLLQIIDFVLIVKFIPCCYSWALVLSAEHRNTSFD